MNYMYMEEIISKDPTVKKVETIEHWTNLVLTYAGYTWVHTLQ